jgi:hypothetical protein
VRIDAVGIHDADAGGSGERDAAVDDRLIRARGERGEQRTDEQNEREPGDPADGARSYRWTTGQVRVRVMPSTAWIRATTSLPSSSTFLASARTITSYGPVTSSAWVTPLSSAI